MVQTNQNKSFIFLPLDSRFFSSPSEKTSLSLVNSVYIFDSLRGIFRELSICQGQVKFSLTPQEKKNNIINMTQECDPLRKII